MIDNEVTIEDILSLGFIEQPNTAPWRSFIKGDIELVYKKYMGHIGIYRRRSDTLEYIEIATAFGLAALNKILNTLL